MAPSSTSSCSLPEARHYNLRSKRSKLTPKMATNRANWDEHTTKTFLDLCIREKNQMNFNSKGLTTLGWQNVYRGFKQRTRLSYDSKKLQNKLSRLRRAYMQWRDLQTQTGLSRVKNTGSIAADDSYWDQKQAENSAAAHDRGKPTPILEELTILFGRTTQDRGTLFRAGGHHERTPTIGSDDSPAEMSQDPIGASSVRLSSKRPTRDEEVDGPPKKKSGSIEDYIRDICETAAAIQGKQRREQEELDLAVQILKQDGINGNSDLYYKALILFKDAFNRMVFRLLKTKKGRLHWIQFNWGLLARQQH